MCACKAIGEIVKSGMDAFNDGNHTEALERLNEALTEAARVGSPIHQAKIRSNMALVQRMRGDVRSARRNYELALENVAMRLGADNPLYQRIRHNLDSLLAAA